MNERFLGIHHIADLVEELLLKAHGQREVDADPQLRGDQFRHVGIDLSIDVQNRDPFAHQNP
jgi:hypothetical protein